MSEKAAIAVDPNVKETAITSSASRDSKELEKTLDDETPVATNEGDDDDIEYPTFFKLVLITIALCLAVFCMALVCSTILTQAFSFILRRGSRRAYGISARLSHDLSLVQAMSALYLPKELSHSV